jgi:hypothetical protein
MAKLTKFLIYVMSSIITHKEVYFGEYTIRSHIVKNPHQVADAVLF